MKTTTGSTSGDARTPEECVAEWEASELNYTKFIEPMRQAIRERDDALLRCNAADASRARVLSLVRSLLSEDGMRESVSCFNVGCELMNMVDIDDMNSRMIKQLERLNHDAALAITARPFFKIKGEDYP